MSDAGRTYETGNAPGLTQREFEAFTTLVAREGSAGRELLRRVIEVCTDSATPSRHMDDVERLQRTLTGR